MDFTSFMNGETNVILTRKLFPVLEELARAEFGVCTFHGGFETEDAADMEESEQELERRIAGYLRGLLKMHMEYGTLIK